MQQRTPEWYAARCGKVTASRIGDLMARTKTGWGASRKNYAAELVIERLTGEPAPSFESAAMVYGRETEPEARAVYAFERNVDVVEVGFVPHPTIAMAGASPDGLVGDDGLVEFKCPNTATHLETLLAPAAGAGAYALQMQFQMACSGRKWCDFVSYDRRLPEHLRLCVHRIERSEKVCLEIEEAVRAFLKEIDATLAALAERYPMARAA